MRLEDLRENYQYHSKRASDIVRYLGFAGIALIWALRATLDGQPPTFPLGLILPGFLIILGLAFDLLHYVVATLVWGIYHRCKEKERGVTKQSEFNAPRLINLPANIFFWGKILAMVIAYCLLLVFLYSHFNVLL